MEYYKIYDSADINIIGVHSQAKMYPPNYHTGIYLPYDRFGERSIWNIPNIGLTQFEPILPEFQFESKSKVTDFVNSNALFHCHLISERVFDMIKTLKPDVFESFEVDIYKKDKRFSYFIIRFPYIRDAEYIDWNKTTFNRTTGLSYGQNPKEIHSFKDFEEYQEYLTCVHIQKEKLLATKIILKKDVIDTDIFRLSFLNHDLFISKRLKDLFEAHKVTGRRYIHVDDLISELSQL
jgi:hypothetical protein